MECGVEVNPISMGAVLAPIARVTVQGSQETGSCEQLAKTLARTIGPYSQRKPVIRIRYLLVLAVVVWAGFHYWTQQRPQAEELQTKQQNLTKQLAMLKQQHQQLQVQSKQLQDKSFIMGYAARQYNLVLPGQVSFDVVSHH